MSLGGSTKSNLLDGIGRSVGSVGFLGTLFSYFTNNKIQTSQTMCRFRLTIVWVTIGEKLL